MEYCDIAGLRGLLVLAADPCHPHDGRGRRVVLHQVPSQLKDVMHILGWDTTCGLTIAG